MYSIKAITKKKLTLTIKALELSIEVDVYYIQPITVKILLNNKGSRTFYRGWCVLYTSNYGKKTYLTKEALGVLFLPLEPVPLWLRLNVPRPGEFLGDVLALSSPDESPFLL